MINEFSRNITGFHPYNYQVKVAELLLAGKNVIISVPTGAGKTWASVIPFLYAKEQNKDGFKIDFPQKMIYSLPLRALTNSIHKDITDNEKIQNRFENIIKQTGEYSDDPYFTKDIIFSTIDQTLSNFLCFPLPLSKSQANINAGAIIGSYLVFDEFHLLDSKLSMNTTLEMLRLLGGLCRFCIMTATMSDEFMEAIQKHLGFDNCEIVTLDDFDDDRVQIKSLLPSKDKKEIFVCDGKLNAKNIVNQHLTKTIVICNRVENAQQVYNEIKTLKNDKTELICLHSRFFDTHRKEKEKRLKELFSKGTNVDAILISTQVIEAGMDISCEVMHTEISPINSFLQRVGRCARFENERGKVFIYDIFDLVEREKIDIEPENEEDKKEIKALNNRYLPYEKEICEKTLQELKKHKTLDGDIPNLLIDVILKKHEQQIIQQMMASNFRERITESWNTCEKNNYRNTIRDIQSVEIVLITEDMKNEVERFHYKFQSIGIFKWSLVGWLKKAIELVDDEDALVWALEENQFFDNDFDEGEKSKMLKKFTDFQKIPSLIFLNANYFGYSEEIGFNNFDKDTFKTVSPSKPYKKKEENFKPLEKDTFYQHNMGLIGCFEKEFLPNIDFVASKLSLFLEDDNWNVTDLKRNILLMILLHDYGKLNNTWQKPIRAYQARQEKKEIKDFKEILAHSNFDKNSEHDIALANETKVNKRPPHAGVGAFLALEVVENDMLKNPIAMAIARHHSSLSNSCPKFEISDIYYTAMQELLNKFDFDITLEQSGCEEILMGCEPINEIILYLYFVRILRICDQKATGNLKEYFNE
jgi:CRISPR-associated endonuclease/helicase Cas3